MREIDDEEHAATSVTASSSEPMRKDSTVLSFTAGTTDFPELCCRKIRCPSHPENWPRPDHSDGQTQLAYLPKFGESASLPLVPCFIILAAHRILRFRDTSTP